jgi:polyisoprenoid-binding protein YceI
VSRPARVVRAFASFAALAALAGCTTEPPRVAAPVVVPAAVPMPTDHERIPLEAAHLRIEADVTAAGTVHTMRFPKAVGLLELAPAAVEASRVEVAIDVRIAEAGWQLVADLGRSEFLEVDRFPDASFTSRAIERVRDPATGAEQLRLFGDLVLHGTRRAVVVPLDVGIDACHVRFASSFAIDRRDYAMVPGGPIDAVVNHAITMRLGLDVRRPSAPPSCPVTR